MVRYMHATRSSGSQGQRNCGQFVGDFEAVRLTESSQRFYPAP